MKRLFLIRGLPGSGKSTLAELITWGANALYATDFHERQSISTDDSFVYMSPAWEQMIDMIRYSRDARNKEIVEGFSDQSLRAPVRIPGQYEFVPSFLPYAHQVCQNRVRDAMSDDEPYDTIIVHNTFSQPWEAAAYYQLAEDNGYEVFVVECQNKFKNTHGVPRQTIDAMRARWLPLEDMRV